ncbi:4Fe-4S dicluster domain-containing protein [candidate division KSB1 bacterium]|nr:MAG: 4Fe-4S dicluster domain-containing protein [candidate division KSB1 bacterium]
MANVTVTIDGQRIEVEEGMYILQAAEQLGIKIPTLCYYPHMAPYAACRICAVEARDNKGWTKIVTACNYPVWDGLHVVTDTPRVLNARRVNLEMLLSRCAKVPVLARLAEEFGITEPRWGQGDDTCIKCGLCVRICDEVVGAHALAFADRGINREISTPFKLESQDCILCGACARYCPTGHIQMTDIEDRILHSELMLGPNAAIRIPFRQAIPNVPRIYGNQCIHMKTGGCMLCAKVCPKECIDFNDRDQIEEIEVGAVVVATGFADFDPTPMKQYGYGKYPNVISALEFEQMNNAASPTSGKIVLEDGSEPRSIAILHCIGSRDENQHKYCSRVCCMYALKFAHLVKEKTSAEVYQLYIDMRAFGKGYEEFYHRILDEGVNVIRGKGAEVVPAQSNRSEEGGLLVCCEDTLIGKYRQIPVDMVVLCTALEARADAADLARKLSISKGADGWFIEAHPKLAPVSTTTDGVFLAGACQGPKDIPDSVAQGSAAACQALRLLSMGEVMLDGAYAVITEELCSGCKICNGLCPYTAISFDETKKVSVVNAALCKACGTCVAACPSGAIQGRHFTDDQIYAQIEGILA